MGILGPWARSEKLRGLELQPEPEPEPEPEPQPQPGGDAVTVDEFTISDVQVGRDVVGDFEVRARVTNNGRAVNFVSLEATVFNGGSVVADLSALEEFDAGETRTVTFFGTDKHGVWDDIEFTIDRGL